jgi:pyruvate/2-oxoglutarate dehydrogenase complex dihydrolipoamide dehydrogenase (E3) component
MADALVHRGIHVTFASRTEAILATVDTPFGKLVEAELQKHGVDVWNRVEVTAIQPVGDQLAVAGTHTFSKTADFVLVAVGVQPNSELGATAGITLGARGSLRVTRRMETNLPNVYAAGDCVDLGIVC